MNLEYKFIFSNSGYLQVQILSPSPSGGRQIGKATLVRQSQNQAQAIAPSSFLKTRSLYRSP